MLMPDVSYEYYYSTFSRGKDGKIPSEEFDYYSLRAVEEVGLRICGEVNSQHLTAVSNAICEVAELLYSASGISSVKSESIDGYSVTYSDPTALSSRITIIVEKHLSKTGLLFRGV